MIKEIFYRLYTASKKNAKMKNIKNPPDFWEKPFCERFLPFF